MKTRYEVFVVEQRPARYSSQKANLETLTKDGSLLLRTIDKRRTKLAKRVSGSIEEQTAMRV